jgi:hypothetical protein
VAATNLLGVREGIVDRRGHCRLRPRRGKVVRLRHEALLLHRIEQIVRWLITKHGAQLADRAAGCLSEGRERPGGVRPVLGGWFQSYLRNCHPDTSHVWIRTYPSKYASTPPLHRALSVLYALRSGLILRLASAIRIFDPEADIGAIKTKAYPPRHAAFRGEMMRHVMGCLRMASDPVTSRDIATVVMKGTRTQSRGC